MSYKAPVLFKKNNLKNYVWYRSIFQTFRSWGRAPSSFGHHSTNLDNIYPCLENLELKYWVQVNFNTLRIKAYLQPPISTKFQSQVGTWSITACVYIPHCTKSTFCTGLLYRPSTRHESFRKIVGCNRYFGIINVYNFKVFGAEYSA